MGKVEMDQTFKDPWKDTLRVFTANDKVYVQVTEGGTRREVELSPKKARKVAKALRKGAKQQEAGRVLDYIDRSFD